MRKYRICMVLSHLGIGGAETHVITLARELAYLGHKVTLVHDGAAAYPEEEGVRRVCLPLEDRRHPHRAIKALSALFARERFDIIHAHARYPALLCRLAKARPLVTTAHWVFETTFPRRLLSVWGEKTLAVSPDIARYLVREYGLSRKDVITTVNGIDTEHFAPAPRRGRMSIVLCSRLDADRSAAAYALIEVAARLSSAPAVRITIIGDGTEYGRLSARAEEINRRVGEERVRLLGARSDVSEVLGKADIFVGVSRAALEAMAAGCATILAGDEGYLSVFSPKESKRAEESNFCCRGAPPMSIARLYEDISMLLSLPRRTLSAMGQENRAYVKAHYSAHRMAEDALSAYRAVTGKRAVLCGYYGFGNVGDELMRQALCARLRRAGYGEICVLSSAHGILEARRALTKRADFFLGGGNLLQDGTSRRSLHFYLGWLKRAQRMGCKTALLSAGIGPLSQEGRECLKEPLAACHLIECRTRADAEEMKGLCGEAPLRLTQDAVLTLPRLPSTEGARVLIALRPYQMGDTLTEYDFMRTVDRAFESISKKEAVLFPLHPEDTAFCFRLGERYGVPVALGGAHRFLSLLGESRLLISNRLHGGICALQLGVYSLLLGQEEKLLRFVRDVSSVAKGLSLPSPCALYHDAPVPLPGKEEILAVRAALSQRCEKI